MIKMSFVENSRHAAIDGFTLLAKRHEVKKRFWERQANLLDKTPVYVRWLLKFLLRIRLYFVLQKELDRLYDGKTT